MRTSSPAASFDTTSVPGFWLNCEQADLAAGKDARTPLPLMGVPIETVTFKGTVKVTDGVGTVIPGARGSSNCVVCAADPISLSGLGTNVSIMHQTLCQCRGSGARGEHRVLVKGILSQPPFQLTKVSEAAHENSRSRARTNSEPTRAFVPLSSHPSEDRPRVTRSAPTTRARMISASPAKRRCGKPWRDSHGVQHRLRE